MSIHVTRDCCVCGIHNNNEIFVNWTEEAMQDQDLMHSFYNEWMCPECRELWEKFEAKHFGGE